VTQRRRRHRSVQRLDAMTRLNPTRLQLTPLAVRVGKRGAVTLLIVVAAMLAVPSWLKWREQPKASESHRYLACVQVAQERYHATHSQYAKDVCDLDMLRPEPTFFAVGELTPGSSGNLADSWSLTLTRFGNTFLFGSYTVTFNENGFDALSSTIDKNLIGADFVAPTFTELASR